MMKRHLHACWAACLLLGCVVLTPEARADRDRAIYGALTGAAIGALIGENSHDINTEVAIPAFAAVGGLMGYYSDRGHYGSRRYHSVYDDDWHYPYRSHYRRHYWPHYRTSFYDYPIRREPARVYVQPAPARTVARVAERPPVAPAPNRTPGVNIVRVPFTWPNGTTRQIRLLHLANRYVGPQGETYTKLPNQEILAERYSPPSR